jgi:hypothetical protein
MHSKSTIWIGVTFLIATCIGGALLIIAARLYVRAMVWEQTHNLQPLILPISLAPGSVRTPEIKTDLDGDYDIVMDLEGFGIRGFRDQRVNCLLGLEPFVSNRCNGTPNLIDISWELFEGDKMVSEGNSGKNPWATWSDTVERMIGRFKGEKGHHYTLVLDVKRNASELNTAHPKIKVQIPRGLWEGYVAGVFIQKLAASMLGLVGVIILVGPFFVWKLKRRKIH